MATITGIPGYFHRNTQITGVSLKTAERALNELIKEGLCFSRPKKGTFVGNATQVLQQKKICGVYHTERLKSFEGDLVQSAMYRGALEQAQKKDTNIIFLSGGAEKDIAFYSSRTDTDFRGILMFHWENLDKGIDLAEKFPKIKFVYLNYYLKEFENTPSNIYGVFNDDYAGMYQITKYLIGKGHKKPAVFGIELRDENYHQRIAGYRQALKESGIRFKELVYRPKRGEGVDLEGLRNIGRLLTRDLFDSDKDPTAIICVNDVMTSGVIEYLRKTGKDKKVEVTGYDNIIPHISKDYNFSTVAIDFEKIGREAINVLFASKRNNYPKVVRICPQVLIRT